MNQTIAQLLTSFVLPYDFLQIIYLFLSTVSGYKQLLFLVDTPKKVYNIHQEICFAYSCISSIQF